MSEWRSGLSVAMLVREPPRQIAAMASLFADVADEIIICVDSRVDEDLLWPLHSVATKLLRVEHSHPFFNTTRWFHDLAEHRWVLHIDGDEVPSTALLSWLGRLDGFEEQITHAYFNRRWVYPDCTEYLVSEPWREDPQLRLSPRDSRLMTWNPGLHDPVGVAGVGIMRSESIYHLDLVERTFDERKAKVDRYDVLTKQVLQGFETTINASYYLPEGRRQELVRLPIPDDDRQLIERVVEEGRRIPEKRKGPQLPIINAREVLDRQRHNAIRTDSYLVGLSPVTPFLHGGSGANVRVGIEVTNCSDWVFPRHDGQSGVAIGWGQNSSPPFDGGRGLLPIDLAPGQSVVVPCAITLPSEPGLCEITFGVVDEGRRWFEQTVVLKVEVLPGDETFY